MVHAELLQVLVAMAAVASVLLSACISKAPAPSTKRRAQLSDNDASSASQYSSLSVERGHWKSKTGLPRKQSSLKTDETSPTKYSSVRKPKEKKNGEGEKADGPRRPATVGMVDTNDPNYMTLAAVQGGQGVFGDDKAGGGGGGGVLPVRPAVGGMAGSILIPDTNDANYMTLAAVQGGQGVFGEDKAGGGGLPMRPAVGGMADTNDANYMTLAAVQGGQGVFGEDKKAAAAGPQKPATGGMAGTYDPNYMTLAAVQGGQGVFGEDKKAAI